MKSANWISGTGRRPFDGRADRDADDHRLGQRRVQHAVAAELVVQPVGGEEDAALLAHVLAQHDDRRRRAASPRRASSRIDSMIRHDGHGQPSASGASGPPSPMNALACPQRVVHARRWRRRRRRAAAPWPDPGRAAPRPSRSRPRRPCVTRPRSAASVSSSSMPASRSWSRKSGSGSRRFSDSISSAARYLVCWSSEEWAGQAR